MSLRLTGYVRIGLLWTDKELSTNILFFAATEDFLLFGKQN